MGFNAESDIVVYVIAVIVYLILVAMIYFFIQSKSRKLAQKMLKDALESEGYLLEAHSKDRKKTRIEKKIVDEVIFFVGFGISIAGLAAKNYSFLLIGIIVSIFSVFLLHLMLRNEEHSIASAIREAEHSAEPVRIYKVSSSKQELNEEEKKLMKEKLSQKKITIIKDAKEKSVPRHDADDIAKFLSIVDEMLEKVPESEISSFAASDEFEIYRKVMKEPPNSINDDLKKLAPSIDSMLGKLPKEDIKRFTNSKDFKVYEKIMGRLV